MTPMTRLGLALSLCLIPTTLFAQDGFPGQYELEGRYTNRRATAVELTVTQTSGSAVVVSRTGRYTSRRHRDKPAFTWTSSRVRIDGRRMHVTYVENLEGSEGTRGMVDRLTPGADRDEVIDALSQTNTFEAVYFLSSNKQEISEIVVNQTRHGDERWWRWISTSGDRVRAPSVTTLSQADYETKRDETIKEWYLEDVREYYDNELADANLTADERRELEEARAIDEDFSNTEIFEEGWWFSDNLEDQYDNGDPYLDAHGRVIPLESLEEVTLSFFPEYAGIGLSKSFLFDTRTGELVDEGDIMD